MIFLDILAAVAIAFGAFVGTRQGMRRMIAGGGAVALGTIAGGALCEPLGQTLSGLGVGYPGDVALAFFLPFALVSVYVRYLIGLWLSYELNQSPERNRAWGAVVGAVWMVFAAGSAGRLAGLAEPPPADERPTSAAGAAPFARWLAKYPGAVGSFVCTRGQGAPTAADAARWSRAVERALDSGRVQARARQADREASAHLRGSAEGGLVAGTAPAGAPPLRAP